MLGERRTWRHRAAGALITTLITVNLAACSSGGPSFSTGSLLPGAKAQVDPATERAMQVAATSARAAQCGYNFDPAKLKTSYLAYEGAQGGSADQVAKLDKTYEFTKGSVAKRMANPDEYCTEEQTAKIKSDLSRHLAGDFSAPKRVESSVSDLWTSDSQNKPWDKQKALCPQQTCL